MTCFSHLFAANARWIFLLLAGLSGAPFQPLRAEVPDAQVASALTKLDALARRTLRQTGVPGMAIAVVHNDEVVFLKGYGVRRVNTNLRVTPDTIFQIASVSKPITSTILASLVGEKRISWDDPVRYYDPGFRLQTPYASRFVTFRDLLCHRSGLQDHAGDLLEDLGYGRAAILKTLRLFPIGNAFRSEYNYTNYGITEAGVAGAKAVGTIWEQLARSRLFGPAGMTSTSARFSDYINAPNHAVNHVPPNENFIPRGRWVPRFTRQPDPQSPAGGVSSSARDLATWMRIQLADGKLDGVPIIDGKALAQTHEPQILRIFDDATGASGFYALCWIVGQSNGRVMLRHSGEFLLGVRSAVALCPKENLGIVILVNAAPNGIPEGLDRSFFDWVFDGRLSRDWMKFTNEQFELLTARALSGDGTDYSKPPAVRIPARPLGDYAGVYRSRAYGRLVIRRVDNRLVAKIGRRTMTLPLRHYNGDTFYYRSKGESQTGNEGAVFRYANGRVRSVTMNSFNHAVREGGVGVDGLGVFRR